MRIEVDQKSETAVVIVPAPLKTRRSKVREMGLKEIKTALRWRNPRLEDLKYLGGGLWSVGIARGKEERE